MTEPRSPVRRIVLRLAAGAATAALVGPAFAAAPAPIMRRIPKSGEAEEVIGRPRRRTRRHREAVPRHQRERMARRVHEF